MGKKSTRRAGKKAGTSSLLGDRLIDPLVDLESLLPPWYTAPTEPLDPDRYLDPEGELVDFIKEQCFDPPAFIMKGIVHEALRHSTPSNYQPICELLHYAVRQDPSGLMAFMLLAKLKRDAGGSWQGVDARGRNLLKSIVDSIDPNTGNAALHVACYRGLPRNVEALLSFGADPRVLDQRGFEPLFYAVQGTNNAVGVGKEHDHLSSVQVFARLAVEEGGRKGRAASSSARGGGVGTPADSGSDNSGSDSKPFDVCHFRGHGTRLAALPMACEGGFKPLAEWLVREAGADVNERGMNPLGLFQQMREVSLQCPLPPHSSPSFCSPPLYTNRASFLC